MQIRCLSVLALAGVMGVASSFGQFADRVAGYEPGLGVSSGHTNAAAALGEPSRVTPGPWGGPVDPFSPAWQGSQIVQVGAGGSLTLHLNPPIQHDRTHPFGCDFIVYGNAGFTITNGDYSGGGITGGSLFGDSTAAEARISVSVDGTNFFALDPALAPPLDALFPTDGTGDFFIPVNPGLVADSFAGLGLAGIRGLYAGSGGGAGYSLSWARTNGVPVVLSGVQFVRIEVVSGEVDIDAVAEVAPIGGGAVWWEDFATDPQGRGWAAFGDPSLFRWNQTNQNLEVTWDSSRTNSYFELPLGTLLTRGDDFSVALDLTLSDIAIGATPGKPGTFQIGFGFLRRANAHQPGFVRGTGSDSPNLVEFDFFPDSGFGPTVWPFVTSTNSVANYNGSSDYAVFDLPIGVPMRFVLSYTVSNQTASVSATTNGVLVGPVTSAPLMATFTQFVLDAFAITSYSDAGQTFFPGSVLAHGVVDNVVVSAPLAPVRGFKAGLAAGALNGGFESRTNWAYVLEGSEDLVSWTNVTARTLGNGQAMSLGDTNAASFGKRFYRIKAEPNF